MSIVKDTIKRSAIYRLYAFPEDKLNKCMEKYLREVDADKKRYVGKKAKWCYVLFDLPFNDFFQCRCDKFSFFNARRIVSYSKGQKPLYKTINSSVAHDVLCDKWKSYQLFKDYYRRDIEFVSHGEIISNTALDKVRFFANVHKEFIVKPLGKNCGKGIQIINNALKLNVFLAAVDSVYVDGFVMEELIHQSELLAKLHPQSVNTLRINTVNYGNGNVEVKWPCLRIGKGDSIVDNAGAGGIFGAVNVDTGTIIACSDEFHHEFTEHPDTKMGLVGFQIPFWKAACDLVKNAALMLPEAKFIGWDLALTDDGYVLVEGNYGPILLYQIATGVGIKKEFDEMKQRLGVC